MIREPRLVDIDAASFGKLPCCGIKNPHHVGRQQKSCWMEANTALGLRAKALLAPEGDPCGYLEFIPGEHAWRGVNAKGYLFIHCIWIYARRHQRKGWGRLLVEACLDEARKADLHGVAVMVREGPWSADRRLFLAAGFETADFAPPDYELMVHKFDPRSANPSFKKGWQQKLEACGPGLTIVRSGQCPHIAKFAAEIEETARSEYRLEPRVVELSSYRQAQNAPTPYAVFSVIYDGKILADHQISRTRFRNIMKQCAIRGRGW